MKWFLMLHFFLCNCDRKPLKHFSQLHKRTWNNFLSALRVDKMKPSQHKEDTEVKPKPQITTVFQNDCVVFVPFPSSQDILYCLDSQYCSSERALLLFQLLSAVLSRAFSPKIRSIPEQLVKEWSRSTVYSVTGGQRRQLPAVKRRRLKPKECRARTCELDSFVLLLQVFFHQDLLLLSPRLLQLLLQAWRQLQFITGLI